MTAGLKRYQQSGEMHFLTFSCWRRLPYLRTPQARDLFESALERIRQKYQFAVIGYVVMPEHVRLLLNEPKRSSLDQAIKALKLSITLRRRERPFWQARYYDFNVFTEKKRVEKLRYMHRNPVVRGLVEKPEDWQWSSFRHYATGVEGTLKVESFWTAWRREHGEIPSQAPNSLAAVKPELFFAERCKRADDEAFLRILNREDGEPPRPEDTID
jgi:putative transposase